MSKFVELLLGVVDRLLYIGSLKYDRMRADE